MTGGFQLGVVPALSRVAIDRGEHLRTDTDGLWRQWPSAKVVVLDARGRTPIPHEIPGDSVGSVRPELELRAAKLFGDEPPAGAVFLGRADVDYWAILDADVPDGETVRVAGRFGAWTENVVADGEMWVGLREYGDRLDDAGAGLFTTALALRNWYRRAKFCAKCGAATTIVQFGWASQCTSCQHEEYPRTDPAVICLVHDDVGVNGERVLLARGAGWPLWARSVLAGFVEAGESLEACVVREIHEEVGVPVRDVRYLGSQPWPFPRSIMLGFAARADTSSELKFADGEIEAAAWFTRDEVRAAFARADQPRPADSTELTLPGNASIARVMLQAWAAAEAG